MDAQINELDNVQAFVEKFFSAAPGEPHSHQLQVSGLETQHDIFQLLGVILTHGIQYLYGPSLDWFRWTAADTHKIGEYFHCLGWEVHINPETPPNGCLPFLLSIPTNVGEVQTNIIFSPLSFA